jgi:hypothetical protein
MLRDGVEVIESGFNQSPVDSRTEAEAKGLRPAMPCHLGKIVATCFAIEFAPNFLLVRTERYS